MCGRFYVDDDTMQEIERIARRIDREKAKLGDVAPTQSAVILQALEDEIVSRSIQWGYERYGKSGVIFNARSESVQERKLFAGDFETHRCLIPAKRFYEWKSLGKEKEQYDFFLPQGILYIAGIYHRDPTGDRFAVLTRNANACMEEVHDRMPVLISEEDISGWLFSKEKAAKLLKSSCDILRKQKHFHKQYEQLQLF